MVKQVFESLQSTTVPELQHAVVRDLVMNVLPRGILTMLGLRKTVGSEDIPWPNRQELEASFNALQTVRTEEEVANLKNAAAKESKLSVGARALAKHAHRDSNSFWGILQGSELKKNEMARVKMD